MLEPFFIFANFTYHRYLDPENSIVDHEQEKLAENWLEEFDSDLSSYINFQW